MMQSLVINAVNTFTLHVFLYQMYPIHIHPACTLYTLNEIPSTIPVDQLNNIVISLRNTINDISLTLQYICDSLLILTSSNKIYSNIVKSTYAYESYIIAKPTTVIEYIKSKVRNLTYK